MAEKKKRQSQLHVFFTETWVDMPRRHPNKLPTCKELANEIIENHKLYDRNWIIKETTATGIIWSSDYCGNQTFNFNSLGQALTRIKSSATGSPFLEAHMGMDGTFKPKRKPINPSKK